MVAKPKHYALGKKKGDKEGKRGRRKYSFKETRRLFENSRKKRE